jgi:hypothetical protein
MAVVVAERAIEQTQAYLGSLRLQAEESQTTEGRAARREAMAKIGRTAA